MSHLVTGASGFLGSALCKWLVDAGERVRGLDDHSRGRPERVATLPGDAFELIEGDVRDAGTVARAARGCSVVWHLAAVNGTRNFYERPDDVLDMGVRGTLAALDGALAAGARRFVFAGSSEAYGEPTTLPTPETEPLRIADPTNPRFSYAGSKIVGELLTLHYGGRRGLEPVIVRPHNVYGPDMGEEHVVPELVRRLVEASDGLTRRSVSLQIQGDGSQTRAYCHIDDAARGFVLAGTRGIPGTVYHLGTPRETTIAELVRVIAGALDLEVTLQPGPVPAGSTPRRCPDISRLAGLGYQPQVDLETGVAQAARWYADWFRSDRIP